MLSPVRDHLIKIGLLVFWAVIAAAGPAAAQLEDFEFICSSSTLKLFINPATTEIAVEDLVSGNIWYSNPQNRHSERGLALQKTSSQFSIFHDPHNVEKNNYRYSTAYDQFAIKLIPNGVRVEYQIVEEWRPEHYVPVMISQDRMEQMILANIEEESARGEVLGAYDLIMLKPADGQVRSSIPGLDKERIFGGYTLEVLNEDYLAREAELAGLEEELKELEQRLPLDDDPDLHEQKAALEQRIVTHRQSLIKTRDDIIVRLVYKIVDNRLDLSRITDITAADLEHLIDTPTYLIKDLPVFVIRGVRDAVIASGYTPLDSEQDHLANNIDPLLANMETFFVPIEYTLDDSSLVVSIPAREIEYPVEVDDRIGQKHSFPLLRISLLEYFGAADLDDEGYIFVPDGSGALINLNNGRTFVSAYNQPVFGLDNALSVPSEVQRYPQTVHLPVFGLKKNGGAFLAIIEEGAPMARIRADISGRSDSYNRAWAEFTLLPSGRISLGIEKTAEMPVYQAEPYKGNFTVRYAFLGGEQADYVGMAACYRDYLINNYQLTRVAPAENIPFFLELIAAIDKREPILGISRSVVYPLTTIEQARSIVSDLIHQGVAGIRIKYSGWLRGGMNHIYPRKAEIEKAIGSEADLRAFGEYLSTLGFELYPAVSLVNVHRDTMLDGFNPKQDASRLLNRLVARVYNYRLDIFDRIPQQYHYVLSPRQIGALTESFLSSYRRYGISSISLVDLAEDLNSDFIDDASLVVDRAEALKIIEAQFEKIKGDGLKVMVDSANSYAFPYAAAIVNAPSGSSRFNITDQEIPFYQIVVHGLINTAGQPINLADSPRVELLRLIETGTYPYFVLTHSESFEVKNTDFSSYYSLHYRDWLDTAVDIYTAADEVLRDVQDQFIVGHRKLADRVHQTTFENGLSVIVNYNKQPVEINGCTIGGEDFIVIKGEDYE